MTQQTPHDTTRESSQAEGDGRADSDGESSEGESDESADGRSLRRVRNVERAIDAVIDLAGEGALDPTWEEISERANVSHRSLYRYFNDRASLLRAAVERMSTRMAPMLDISDLGLGPLDERMARFVDARLSTYRGFGPIARTAFLKAEETEIRDGIEASRSMLREQLVAQFAPELQTLNHRDRTLVTSLLDVPFQFESLEYLSQRVGLDDDDVEAILIRHLSSHLLPLATG